MTNKNEFNKDNFVFSIPNYDELIKSQEQQITNVTGIPANRLNNTSISSIAWSAQILGSNIDKGKAIVKAIQNNYIDIINVQLNIKPNKLPRKLKKAYKKGLRWAINKIYKKYPSYFLKDCQFQFDDSNEFMKQQYNINYKSQEITH